MTINEVVLVSLFLILNIFHILFLLFTLNRWVIAGLIVLNSFHATDLFLYHRRRFDVFIVNFEHILHLVLVFLLLTLSR